MFHQINRGFLPVVIVLGLSSCVGGGPTPSPSGTAKPAQSNEKIVISTTSIKALCTRLDYSGSQDNPSSATLTCQDGDEITIPGPFPEGKIVGKQTDFSASGAQPGDGKLDLVSKQGLHHVWYYLVASGGELRVFYDDQLVQHSSNADVLISKIVMRNFRTTDTTTSVVWQ